MKGKRLLKSGIEKKRIEKLVDTNLSMKKGEVRKLKCGKICMTDDIGKVKLFDVFDEVKRKVYHVVRFGNDGILRKKYNSWIISVEDLGDANVNQRR